MYVSNGIGLAAVQIGILKRILVVDVSTKDEKNQPIVLINPVIKNISDDNFIGRLTPIAGAMITQENAVLVYSGIEGNFSIGNFTISPSFSPGYYEKGDGIDLGSALEFKSEIKVGIDIFENSKLSYSYSHISNNDWGDTNPGTDNQHITFSKSF